MDRLSRTVAAEALALVRLFRPLDWWYFVPAPLLGARLAEISWDQPLAMVSAAFCLAFAYGINGIYDHTHDSPQKNPYAGLRVVPRRAMILVLLTPAPVLLLTVSGLTSAWPLISLAAGVLYSAPPLRLKQYPILGDAMNMAIFLPLLLAPADIGVKAGDWAWLLWFVLQLEISQIIHCIQDADEDRLRGGRNMVGLVGQRGSRNLLLPLAGLSFLVALGAPSVGVMMAMMAGALISLAIAVAGLRRIGRAKTHRLLHRYLNILVLALIMWVL